MRCPTLADLPTPPEGKTGWPWTKETLGVTKDMPDTKFWPKVSIVTPSYNQDQFIEETIRSVLLQGYPDIDYIVIDGGSTDKSVEIIRKYERWITFWTSESDGGQTNAINKGIKRSTGEVVTWLNSDDLYTEGAFFVVANAFVKQPHSTVIYGKIDIIDTNTSIISHKKSHRFDLEKLYFSDYIPQPASFINTEAIKKIGLLDERFHYVMDYDLWIRLGNGKGLMQYIPATLACFRLHNSSKSVSQQEAFCPERFMLFDKSLKSDTLNTPLVEIAYSRMFESLILCNLFKKPQKILRYPSISTLNDHTAEMFYQQPIQEVLKHINKDHRCLEDTQSLIESLHRVYQAFDNEYNFGKSKNFSDVKNNWVDEQLTLLPNYLLNLGEKTKSIRLYKEIICMRPNLIKYPQIYRFAVMYILRSNLLSRVRRMIV